MYNSIRQATAHKPIKVFLKFILVLFRGDAVRSRCTFLAMIRNFKLTNMNGRRIELIKIIKDTVEKIGKPFSEIIHMTAVVTTNIARKVSNLRLVTDVR